MSWETILKKKKVNMDHLRQIVDHLLTQMEDEFSLEDFSKMVVSTYKHYNVVQRPLNLKSILAQMLRTRGYAPFFTHVSGNRHVNYRKV